jgi:uncharacterized protein
MEAPNGCTVLMVPGYTNSGPDHWQTRWEKANPQFVRVQQRSWDQPQRDEWVDGIDKAVKAAPGRVVLVGHSIGCVAVAHWALTRGDPRVAAAILVAPTDPEKPGLSKDIKGFAPMPLKPLPFPSIFVASSNDPYTNIERARFFARKWGSRLVEVGNKGHINSDAGFGDWPEGEALLAELLRSVEC